MRGKNKMRSKIVFLCGALAFAASSAAVAQINTGFYGGVGIGKAKAKLNGSDFTFNSPAVVEGRDELDTAYKFFGGYQLNRYLATELSYTDLGKFAYTYNIAGFGESRVNYKAKSWAFSALGSIPLGRSGFSALARLGLAYNVAERSALTGDFFFVPNFVGAGEKKRLSPIWGVGGAYDFTPMLSVRLEYEDYGRFGEAQGDEDFFTKAGRARIHMYSLNFIARF